ncbi:MAG: SGNH/GDSL hydrolase family protein [Planctomycetales bacterium]|nr:SGNH/GDSL hydrolase family protein [Planctomycetales bacterium]
MSKKKKVAFRLLAIGIGLLPFVAIEGVLRFLDFNALADVDDPYVGFAATVPLFKLNEAVGVYEIPASRYQFFRPESFPAEKKNNEFRIFCFGGSTVQGRPYAIETSLTSWLEINLDAADPSRDWDVINCGGVSYASYRLVPIMKECLKYDPDLFIVCTGHNEFLEDRTYGKIKSVPEWQKAAHERLLTLKTYRLANYVCRGSETSDIPARSSDQLSAEVDALLDYKGGLEKYHRDDAWKDGVVAHYEVNLRRMARICKDAGVPLLFINPVSNLRDTPPFKHEPNASLTSQQQDEIDELWEQAKTIEWEQVDLKIESLEKIIAIDQRHANAHYFLGRCYETVAAFDKAKTSYERGKDEDICPLRMLESMHAILFNVARQTNTPVVDARALLEDRDEHGITGNKTLIDHVHPHIKGHQLIADAILDRMEAQGLVTPQPNWKDTQAESYRKHFEALPNDYFPQSMARLEGLKRWTQGRVERMRSND